MAPVSSLSRRAFGMGVLGAAAGRFMAGDTRRILVHGHRGARARRPENTIPAFQYAIEQGVDVLELDVAVTKDNVLVVSHDPHINATICEGPRVGAAIHDMSFAELEQHDCGAKKNPGFATQVPVPGTRVPKLDDVFALSAGNSVWFNVETKIFADHPELTPDPETFTRMILDLVRKHGLEKRVILQSFDPRTLRVMKKLDPSIPRAALWETKRDWKEVAEEFEATLFSPEYVFVTPEHVAEAHRMNMQVVPWTVDKEADWQKMADAGVDAIITDDPESLIAWLKARGLR